MGKAVSIMSRSGLGDGDKGGASVNGRDAEINSYALPILTQETTSAQSAGIDMVSGATVTSTGYIQSLQSAIDQAKL